MKRFFLTMCAVASVAGAAVAQEVVASYDFSKMREYPWGIPDGVNLVMENQCLNASGSGWWQFQLAEAQLEPETPYTISVCIKADKKGQTPFAVGNWSGDDFQGLADSDQENKIKYSDKWAVSSCVMTTKTAANPLLFMFQPGGFDGTLNIAWVVVSKGHCEPEFTPLMPVDLSTAETISEVNFADLAEYPYEGESASIVDGLLTNVGEDIFNVMEGLKLEEGVDYGVIARVKSSSDVEVGVSLGDWGAMVDGSFLAYDAWNEVVVRLGNAPVDEEGNIPNPSFVMFGPEDGYEGTIEVAWVKLVEFPEIIEVEPVYECKWTKVIDNLTGDNGEDEHVYCRYGENGAWTDEKAGVCDNPAGEGKVFFCEVPAHPDVEDDPIPDHHRQFFIQYPENKFHVGDSIHVKFDYYETAARHIDTQSHMTPGDYIFYMFIGSFDAEPRWQTYETTVELTDQHVRGEDGQACVTLNLCTKLDQETVFYMNNITIDKGEMFLVTDAVETIDAAPAKAVAVPGVYNFQGVKVANSLDEVTVPGLYIANGKKVVKK